MKFVTFKWSNVKFFWDFFFFFKSWNLLEKLPLKTFLLFLLFGFSEHIYKPCNIRYGNGSSLSKLIDSCSFEMTLKVTKYDIKRPDISWKFYKGVKKISWPNSPKIWPNDHTSKFIFGRCFLVGPSRTFQWPHVCLEV